MVDGTVKVPLFGQVKKTYAYAGGAAIAGIGGYVLWRRKQQSAAAASASASTTPSVTDPAGNVCEALDPTTGYCPGTTQDLAIQSQTQGGFTGGGGGGGTGTTGTTEFTTDGEWVQAIEQQLSEEGSQETADAITIALGKYVAGSPVTPDMVTIIQQGIGLEGYPPVNGPTGYPPAINTSGGGGSPPPTTVTWKKVTANGHQTLAEMQIAADANVTFAQVLAKNDWASKYTGKDIPAGYGVYLGYAS